MILGIVKQRATNTITRFGQRSVVQFEIGSEIVKVWGDANDSNLFSLQVLDTCEIQKKGQNYELIKKIEKFTAAAAPHMSEQQKTVERELYKTIDAETAKRIKKEIRLQTKIWKNCLDEVCTQLEEYNFTDENLRATATTIYIKVTKPV
jgi:hypothetical protein